jgi:hypothetical protein
LCRRGVSGETPVASSSAPEAASPLVATLTPRARRIAGENVVGEKNGDASSADRNDRLPPATARGGAGVCACACVCVCVCVRERDKGNTQKQKKSKKTKNKKQKTKKTENSQTNQNKNKKKNSHWDMDNKIDKNTTPPATHSQAPTCQHRQSPSGRASPQCRNRRGQCTGQTA